MLSVWTLLATAICAVSVSAISQRLVIHGHQLSLDLPERTKKLEFASGDESEHYTVWEHKTISLLPGKASKGVVSSASEGWTYRIRYVTFDDEGTYTLYNHFGSAITTYIVKVKTNREVIDRIAGETLTIPLSGLKQSDATLNFYSNYSSITLVENGIPVGRNHPDYINRLKVTSDMIQILNVNVSDLGRYELTDLKRRLVSNNTMILVDHHDYTPNKGLIALLLLGIPGGICFCCRKRICGRCRTTKSYTNNAVPMSIPGSNTVTNPAVPVVPVVPTGPVAPHGPGNPGQGYVAGYPPHPDQGQIHYPYPTQPSGQPIVPLNPGFYPEYVPQNPVYPPGPPSAQPPQWNGPPPQYNPSAPVNYTPVMNSAPPAPEPTHSFNTNELPPTAPLLTPQPEKFVIHGHQLSLKVPERTKKLEFASADENEQYTVWERKLFSFLPSKASKGEIRKGYSKSRRFIIRHVTFDDEGTYTLYNYFGSAITTYIVRVKTNQKVIDRIAGETLTIPLSGLNQSDVTLNFYSNYSSVTLVENGIPVGQNHTDYINRLKVTSDMIQILNVNVSDLGRYELTDLKGRLVSNNTMILVDHHEYTPNKGLIALLLLLGIPGGICFCCRKRICRRCRTTKSYTHTGQPCSNTVTDPLDPVTPESPEDPAQDYIAGYPPHPDQDPIYYPYPTEPSEQPDVPPNPSQPSVLNSISMDILNSSDTGVQFDIQSSGNSFL
ncbi:proline-rich receptor kinase [Labeo rohita]|uniref:Proline-rich receptor kinase n=1 Tax=Labeo rohita TaxID=84645 RepID=A0A498MJP5_LABRO|nr:proline-rich receptor kinase [Labeo rohita]